MAQKGHLSYSIVRRGLVYDNPYIVCKDKDYSVPGSAAIPY